MGKSSAPKPPDPWEVASAQTGTNIGTAISNAWLNNTNQVTPNGSLTYDQSGTYKYKDPYTGETYNIPRFTATQTLSPEQMKIKQQLDGANFNLAGLANQQSGFLKDYMSKPFDVDAASKATSDRLYNLGTERLDPRFEQEREALATRLTNQGIRLGSTAYDRAMGDFGQTKNDAYNQLALSGNAQAFSQAMAARNQPLNELAAMMSGSQVSQPNFVNTPSYSIPTTDVAGIINNNYQQKMAGWQAEQQQSQGFMGGLFGLGSSAISAFSDRRLKTDVQVVGMTFDGQAIYAYRMKEGGPVQMGLMADEVERRAPDAVSTDASGFLKVDYSRALGLG